MKITCRNCGATIPAANINIQEMVALCDDCNHIFALDRRAFARKPKRVIPKRPPRIQLHSAASDDDLVLSYRMALGAGPTVGLFGTSAGSLFLSITLIGMIAENAPPGPILIAGMLLLAMLYTLLTIITTMTRISTDEDTLRVETGPLPFPISDNKTLNLNEIKRIYTEQTIEAFSGGIPAHHVYAEMYDNRRETVVSSLPHEYANYLALLLDDHLQTDVGPAHEQLTDSDAEVLDLRDITELASDDAATTAALDGEIPAQHRSQSH